MGTDISSGCCIQNASGEIVKHSLPDFHGDFHGGVSLLYLFFLCVFLVDKLDV